jgi:hypothetical protein
MDTFSPAHTGGILCPHLTALIFSNASVSVIAEDIRNFFDIGFNDTTLFAIPISIF